MFLMKISFGSFVLSLGLFIASYLSSLNLPEAKQYHFPESVGRHFAKATGGSTEFGEIAHFQQKLPIQNGSVRIREIELETVAVDIEIETHDDPTLDTIELALSSRIVDKDQPVLVDTSRGEVLRISSNEASQQNRRMSFMVFNFNDQDTNPTNTLLLRVPKEIEVVKVQTTSGDLVLKSRPKEFRFHSTSGNALLGTANVSSGIIQNLTVETVSGDLSGVSDFESLRFNSVSGNVQLKNWRPEIESIASQTVSGDFRIDLEPATPGEAQAVHANISFESKSGDLLIDGDRRETSSLKLGRGRAEVSIKSTSGNFELNTKSSGSEKSETE